MSGGSSTLIPHVDTQKVLQILQPNGRLSLAFKGYEPREQQQQMLLNILDAYNGQHITLIEAGTGTGKTMAYLIPAMIWAAKHKQRTLISTNTINLQEQLIEKDIPLLSKALGIECHAVLVKGMHNYVCLRKLGDAQEEAPFLPDQEKEEIFKISAWSQSTLEGSRNDLPFIPSGSSWDKVNAESDACNNTECPFFNRCFFFKARREAQDAQLLVVNHHLLFADLACRAEADNYEDSSVLPPYQHVIVDEAHHLEDIATEFFADHVSRIDILRTMARLASEKHGIANGKIPLLKKKIADFFGKDISREATSILSRLTMDLPATRRELLQQLGDAFQAFTLFLSQISPSKQEEAGPGESKVRLKSQQYHHTYWKDEIVPRVNQFISLGKTYSISLFSLMKDIQGLKNDKLHEQVKSLFVDIEAYVNRLIQSFEVLDYFINSGEVGNRVRWIETQQLNTLQNVHLMDAELDVSQHLVNAFFKRFSTIVICSATLTTNQKFEFIRNRWGLKDANFPGRSIKEHIYGSPFNYQQQALLAVPSDMPLPSDPRFNQAAAEQIWNAIKASRGNAFVLFTSYGMLKTCHEILSVRLAEQGYPVFKQGDNHRQVLLDGFKNTDRSVLFGTDSFWEGVDVVGDALRCVIIVKLPFKVPSEPMVQARTENILEKGGDPFYDYSVPHAIVKFKQGFGRLIRNKQDRGCIVCLDVRVLNKTYGKLFLNSLPTCQQVFAPGKEVQAKMEEFYRKTYYLVKKEVGLVSGIGA